ncbi:MAG: hypothetical protein KME25_30475 [Symplocastrum torsivum CPER-KK1]|uniref:Uncharacterized protein n=1 Tax=Symplocastrum torsivum CPER-KK1 TaxID=450513 RepID=A0A951UD91_9CYAN|nr:hypothetical protein [Symplocastrum torsivum CPER-KK1]
MRFHNHRSDTTITTLRSPAYGCAYSPVFSAAGSFLIDAYHLTTSFFGIRF